MRAVICVLTTALAFFNVHQPASAQPAARTERESFMRLNDRPVIPVPGPVAQKSALLHSCGLNLWVITQAGKQGPPFLAFPVHKNESRGFPAHDTGPKLFSLGPIVIPGMRILGCSEEDATRVMNRMTFELEPDGSSGDDWLAGTDEDVALSVTTSRLTPALRIDATAESLTFFEPGVPRQPESEYASESGDERINVFANKKYANVSFGFTPLSAPNYFAAGSAESSAVMKQAQQDPLAVDPTGKKTYAFDAGGANPWMLCWFGANKFIHNTYQPWVLNKMPVKPENPDMPMLFVFENPPARVTSSSLGMRIEFDGPAGVMLLVPLYGERRVPAEETAVWAGELPDRVVEQCRWWSERLRSFPLDVEERWALDGDSIAFSQTVEFENIGGGGVRFCPIPPMLALAADNGFPVSMPKFVEAMGIETTYGPYRGIDDAETLEFTIKGIVKYARERRVIRESLAPDPIVDGLRVELARQVEAMIKAGHLRPWHLAAKTGRIGWGGFKTPERMTWSNAGEMLAIFSMLFPALAPDARESALAYMKEERAAYPPELPETAHTPPAEGAMREGYRDHFFQDNALSKFGERYVRENEGRNFYSFNRVGPIESLYGLAEYHCLLGEKPSVEEWERYQNLFNDYDERREWASMGWFTWESMNMVGGTGGAIDANRAFAGAVGFMRMAEMLGDAGAAACGAAMLARAAVLRFASSKYRYYNPRKTLDDPQWMISEDVAASGYQSATPFTRNWRGPVDDIREFLFCNELGTHMAHFRWFIWNEKLIAFRDMVPELGRFLREHAREESEAYAHQWENLMPDWFMAMCPNQHAHESNTLRPECVYQLFLAHAWIFLDDAKALASYIDVPWVKRGDLYYMHKLAETMAAEQGWDWAGGERVSR